MARSAGLRHAGYGESDFDAIHGAMLLGFRDLVRDLGGEADSLFAQAGVRLSEGPGGKVRATYRQFVALLELSADRLGCLDFGMRLATRQARTAFDGPLGDGMRNSRNFAEALEFVSTHSYAHSLAAWIWFRTSFSGEDTIVGHDILLDGLPQKSQAMEYILLVGNLAILELTGNRVRARKVLFRHQPVSPIREYRRHFGCELRFGRNADAVIYHGPDLACPLHTGDGDARDEAARVIESRFPMHKPPLSANVRGVVFHLLGTELCTKDRVAASLGIHPRTMLRRLADEGTSFQLIKDQVRRDRLIYYAGQTDFEFITISERLGFAEQSVMTRSSRKWFGLSPTDLRCALRQKHSGDRASAVLFGQAQAAHSAQKAA